MIVVGELANGFDDGCFGQEQEGEVEGQCEDEGEDSLRDLELDKQKELGCRKARSLEQ